MTLDEVSFQTTFGLTAHVQKLLVNNWQSHGGSVWFSFQLVYFVCPFNWYCYLWKAGQLFPTQFKSIVFTL